MGTGTFTATFSENWSRWGVSEFDGTNYTVIYVNGTQIQRRVLPTGTTTTVQTFTSLSDMACFTYSPWHSRWYFHYEGSAQFGGSAETAGYAAGTHTTTLSNLCQSTLTPVTVTVNSIFTAPVVNNQTVFCGQTASLTATGGNGSYYWFSDPAGTNQLSTSATYTTPALTSTTQYYVRSGTTTCASPMSTVTVTVNTNIPSPTASGTTINCGQTATLTASGSPSTYAWYADPAGNTLLGTGASYTTPSITASTTLCKVNFLIAGNTDL